MTAHSNAANPVTAMVARAPSPDNMAAWRTVWPHQEECRARIDALAAATASAEEAAETRERTRKAFDEIERCLNNVAERVLEPTR